MYTLDGERDGRPLGTEEGEVVGGTIVGSVVGTAYKQQKNKVISHIVMSHTGIVHCHLSHSQLSASLSISLTHSIVTHSSANDLLDGTKVGNDDGGAVGIQLGDAEDTHKYKNMPLFTLYQVSCRRKDNSD